MLWSDISEADDGVVKSNGGELEGLGFNLCVVPFLNLYVPNLPQGVKDGESQSWLECVRGQPVFRSEAVSEFCQL